MSSSDPGPRLRGRRRECEALDQLVADARTGQSQVLVLRGEAGVGKTALLEHLVERASGCRITRAAGVESEMELAFSGLHQLCAPFLDRIERLPGPQAGALGATFGLRAGAPPDRLLVGLAVLTLLADVAEDRPLVCVVDDAQWLDRATAQALAFTARRLAAESVALVFAVREHGEAEELRGLPDLTIRGLADDDARVLLESVATGPLDERVSDRIVAETRGNPLALLEWPRGLTPAELAGGFGLPDTVPLAGRIEQNFVRRIEALPPETRRLLLTAAIEPVGDVTLLWRAADRLGIAVTASAAAEAAGLVEIGTRVRFRHPLVRSAACRMADAHELRDVHRAVAEVTDLVLDPDRRAWHLARAAVGPDEAVAEELEQSAERARARGGVAAAAAFLQRSTELTPDPLRRGVRALDAAQAKFDAAAPETALGLLATAELCPLDPLHRAMAQRLRAELTFARRRGDATSLLLDAARGLERLDVGLARDTYLDALGAGIFAGRLAEGHQLRDTAEAARAAPPGRQPPRAADLLLDGLAVRLTDGYAAAVQPLRRAVDAFSAERGQQVEDVRWLWLAWLVAYELWDDELWNRMTVRLVEFARETGALTVLPIALLFRAQLHVQAGQFAATAVLLDEVDGLKEAMGNTPLMHTSTTSSGPMVLAAWGGHESRTLELIEATVRDAKARGEGRAISLAQNAKAVLHNGLGQYDAALAAAREACEHEDLALFAWTCTELVEAGVRSGDLDGAGAALRHLEERTSAAGTDWALGIEARCRALLSPDGTAEPLYRVAIERLGRTRIRVALARAHLLYGEWLRRQGRRTDAREQLRTAHRRFTEIGMEAFAERARRELLATGEKARKRSPETRDDLTAQEAQIARLAADGCTNPEIASQLFISTRTVEWHLHKIFAKLGISSRRQLRTALAAAGRA